MGTCVFSHLMALGFGLYYTAKRGPPPFGPLLFLGSSNCFPLLTKTDDAKSPHSSSSNLFV